MDNKKIITTQLIMKTAVAMFAFVFSPDHETKPAILAIATLLPAIIKDMFFACIIRSSCISNKSNCVQISTVLSSLLSLVTFALLKHMIHDYTKRDFNMGIGVTITASIVDSLLYCCLKQPSEENYSQLRGSGTLPTGTTDKRDDDEIIYDVDPSTPKQKPEYLSYQQSV